MASPHLANLIFTDHKIRSVKVKAKVKAAPFIFRKVNIRKEETAQNNTAIHKRVRLVSKQGKGPSKQRKEGRKEKYICNVQIFLNELNLSFPGYLSKNFSLVRCSMEDGSEVKQIWETLCSGAHLGNSQSK